MGAVRNFQDVTLGGGVFKYDGVSIGFIKGDVSYTYDQTTKDFETDVPLKTYGKVIIKSGATMKVPMAELSITNLAMAMGGLTPVSGTYDGAAGQQINLGALLPLAEKPIEFVHTSPVSGKRTVLYMHKASVAKGAALNFKEQDWNINEVEFTAIADDSHTDSPLGWIWRED